MGDADVGQDASHIDALLRELPGATKKSTPDELAALLGKWVVTLSGPGANFFGNWTTVRKDHYLLLITVLRFA